MAKSLNWWYIWYMRMMQRCLTSESKGVDLKSQLSLVLKSASIIFIGTQPKFSCFFLSKKKHNYFWYAGELSLSLKYLHSTKLLPFFSPKEQAPHAFFFLLHIVSNASHSWGKKLNYNGIPSTDSEWGKYNE